MNNNHIDPEVLVRTLGEKDLAIISLQSQLKDLTAKLTKAKMQIAEFKGEDVVDI